MRMDTNIDFNTMNFAFCDSLRIKMIDANFVSNAAFVSRDEDPLLCLAFYYL